MPRRLTLRFTTISQTGRKNENETDIILLMLTLQIHTQMCDGQWIACYIVYLAPMIYPVTQIGNPTLIVLLDNYQTKHSHARSIILGPRQRKIYFAGVPYICIIYTPLLDKTYQNMWLGAQKQLSEHNLLPFMLQRQKDDRIHVISQRLISSKQAQDMLQ